MGEVSLDEQLFDAIEKSNIDEAVRLIDNEANINATDKGTKQTPLMHATIQGLTTVVEKLLNKGADADKQDNTGKTAYEYAMMFDKPDIAHILLPKTSIVHKLADYSDELSNTLLTAVSDPMKQNTEEVLELISNPKIDINIKTRRYETPLILAANKGKLDIVRVLLGHKDIDVNATTDRGKTALIVACANKKPYIDPYGKEINPFNEGVVLALLQHPGLVVNAKDKNNKTALEYLNESVPVEKRSDELTAAISTYKMVGGSRRSRRSRRRTSRKHRKARRRSTRKN